MSSITNNSAPAASAQFASLVQNEPKKTQSFASKVAEEPRVNYSDGERSERLSSPVKFGQSFKKVTGMGLLDTMPVQWLIFTECPCEVTAPARIDLNFMSLAMTGNLRPNLFDPHEISRSKWFKTLASLFSRAAARRIQRGGRRYA